MPRPLRQKRAERQASARSECALLQKPERARCADGSRARVARQLGCCVSRLEGALKAARGRAGGALAAFPPNVRKFATMLQRDTSGGCIGPIGALVKVSKEHQQWIQPIQSATFHIWSRFIVDPKMQRHYKQLASKQRLKINFTVASRQGRYGSSFTALPLPLPPVTIPASWPACLEQI